MKRKELTNKKAIITGAVLAVLFGTAMVFGTQLEKSGGIAYDSVRTWLFAFAAALPAFACIEGLFFLLAKYENRQGRAALRKEKAVFWRTKGFWCVAFVLALCWLPVFLAAFPGFFLYDAEYELNMVLTREFSTHHPLAHVLLLGGAVKAVEKLTGSYNAGIAVYLCCQAVFTAMSFSYMLQCLKRWGVSRWIRVLSGLYLALFPVVAMYALCSTKDTLFTVFLLLFLFAMIQLPERFARMTFIRAVWPAALWGVLMMLFRNNGVYAFLVALPFLLFAAGKVRKQFFAAAITMLALYFGCAGALQIATHADHSEHQEILTVFIQQLARVHAYERDTFDEEELDKLYSFLPKENLDRYRPDNSDLVKIGFQNARYEESGGEFWKLWLHTGLKRPAVYLNSFFGGNYGFWYPYTILNCYSGNQVYTFVYRDSSYFGFETELPGVRKSLLPGFEELLRQISLEVTWQNIPGLRVLFHPAYYFWLFLFAMCYQFVRGRRRAVCGGMMILALVATVFFGPQVIIRYVLHFYYGFPLLLTFLFEADQIEKKLRVE